MSKDLEMLKGPQLLICLACLAWLAPRAAHFREGVSFKMVWFGQGGLDGLRFYFPRRCR